ncbi:MAG: ATP synthase F1 subunit gamma [Clostridia bacterium]|nr:ATP synthase F1 subunit gamma [Clostridia bacterium]
MGNLSELKNRLHAIKQTRQITGAMYLLSTSRMKKAIQNVNYNIDYLHKLRSTINDIISTVKYNELTNRFIEMPGEGVNLYVSITSDKGLCGSYNSDIVNKTYEELRHEDDYILLSIGSVGTEMFENLGILPDYSWCDVLLRPSVSLASSIAETIIELYTEHEIDEAYIVYSEYNKNGNIVPVCKRVLPLLRRDFLDIEPVSKYDVLPIYEPSINEVFEKIVPSYLTSYMYDVFMQSAAAENSSRMKAMQNATENADKMIDELSAKINAERQLAITNEILEISAATNIKGAV